ncbi:MAG TPA: 2-octaprenyl-3-methyl-6-methoxy-1,4-benzoquinol hydroxylase [Gammaproteobacteria bacterium]|nr:2-octaprenyl-3-methyl-6-methoxy-1,4-benzoquinol hydroxylase [Gammaproteobacteria bacterium]
MNITDKYDVIIIGGGMVGASLACALADSTLSIAVIEGLEPPGEWPADSFDIRVSAITRASENLFRRLGAWPAMETMRVQPYEAMDVWDATGAGHIHFDAAELGEPNLGHIIENRVITQALLQRLRQYDNIDYCCPTRPTRLMLRNDHAQLQLDDGYLLQTSLIIGADGAHSWLRQQAGIEVQERHYQQTAVVATVQTGHYHGDTAWQCFLPSGPLAFLPLPDGRSSIVWSTSAEEAERLLALDDADFMSALGEAFMHRLGSVTGVGPRGAFPLKGRHAKEYVKPHLALVGDAAHTIHPLAGQGVNLGLADVEELAAVVLEAHHAQRPIDSFKTLRRYERARRGANLLMLDAMGAFKALFSNDTPGLRELRNLGLNLADHAGLLKRLIVAQAMGLSTLSTSLSGKP